MKRHAMNRSYESATGTIDYTLTNDFMFHYLLQKNETVLRELCSAVLHLGFGELRNVRITNPIELSDKMDNKTFILDVRLLLNDNTLLNLEMQVVNYKDWPERSLTYLCRSFDHLISGEPYKDVKPVIHIGILDFDLFPDMPEFYAKNLLMNVKNHKVFTTKFQLNVLCLKQIDRASEEDRRWHIDQWARLFKAKTWEELKMIAKNDAALESAGKTLFTMNADYLIREKARAREDFERNERSRELRMEELNRKLTEQQKALAKKDAALAQKDEALAQKEKIHADALAEKDKIHADALAEKDKEIAALREQLVQTEQKKR